MRAPRLMLAGTERKTALETLKAALATRPAVKIVRNASCRQSGNPLPLKILFAELKLHKLARRHFETVAEAGGEILTGIESIREACLGDGTPLLIPAIAGRRAPAGIVLEIPSGRPSPS